jgi:hypothetical protein
MEKVKNRVGKRSKKKSVKTKVLIILSSICAQKLVFKWGIPLTQVGEYRKIPAFGLGSSLGLRPWELPRPHAGISLYSPPLV